jgi:hypothetical protein
MAKIKILDLQKDQKISKEEMKRITGGGDYLNLQSSMNMTNQQTQLLSNISKEQHDTLLAIIQNLRA